MRNPTAEEVKQYKVERQCSFQEAKQALDKQNALQSIADAESLDDLKSVLTFLVDRL